jgi:hypothetical protein
MPGWLKIVIGLLLSLAIFASVSVFVYDQHPMRPHYSLSNENCAADAGYGSESRIDCYDEYRRIMDDADRSDLWASLAAGAGAVALFWLLANLFYIRPRRRRQAG